MEGRATLKVFVTGADGFIGSHVVDELLLRGVQVTALVQYNSFNQTGWLESVVPDGNQSLEVVHGDVRDAGLMRDLIRGHSHVAHLAALIAIPYSYAAPSSYVETNVVGTLNVLEACRANEVERIIHTSTSEVYGTAQYVPIDERHPLVGQSPYSASKISADQLAHSFWASFSAPVVTVRPFNTYGPRQSQRAFIPSVIVQLLSGASKVHLGSLSPTRDLTFVADTARGFADVLQSSVGCGRTFNMGSGFEVSMQEVFELLCDIGGHEPDLVIDDRRLRPEGSEVERLWSDSSEMSKAFGWAPTYARVEGLRRGLEETFHWFRNASVPGLNPSRYVV